MVGVSQITRYTINSSVLDGMIDVVMTDTEEYASKAGEEGARARSIRALYPPLIRWLAQEMDMQTQPSDVAVAFSDCGGILTSTVLYNVTDSRNLKRALDFMFTQMKGVTQTLASQSEHFEKIDMQEAGEG